MCEEHIFAFSYVRSSFTPFGMFETIKNLNKTLTKEDRTEGAWLFVLILISALFETLGVVSVLPFLAVVAKPGLIETNSVLAMLYQSGDFTSQMNFLYFLGVCVLFAIVGANAVSAFMNWRLSVFTHMRAHTLSMRILKIYLFLPYIHFLRRDTMDMAKNILSEVSHVSKNLFVALLQAFSRAIVAFFIIVVLIINNPVLALTVGGILTFSYIGIYAFVRKKLQDVGEVRLKTTTERFKVLSEVLKGVKDIRLNTAETKYLSSYERSSYATSLSYAQYDVISMMPKYVLETVAFTTILVVILYLMQNQNNFLETLPELGFYAIAGQRLLPALQNIFLNITKIKYGLPSLIEIIAELSLVKEILPDHGDSAIELSKKLTFNSVNFRYRDDLPSVLQDLSFEIGAGQKVAFVGSTGSGKSTIIDLLSGLLFPDTGKIFIDDVAITQENAGKWQRSIGYVPQNIFLFNDTFSRNIAVESGDETTLDMERVKQAARMAQLHEFIENETEHGYDTMVGENGIRLSGGQRQRLGLARAFYADRPVLVLDEATSALDNVTEQAVMEAITSGDKKKTVIMVAHRLSTVAKCDIIYYLDKGKIGHQGTYNELLGNSPEFRALAEAGGNGTSHSVESADNEKD